MTQELILSSLLFIPLAGSLIAFLAGKLCKPLSGWIATAASATCFAAALNLTGSLTETSTIKAVLVDQWIKLPDLNVNLALHFDSLSALMCLIISGIGSLIHLYSIAYMKEDEGEHRYFAYLNLFLFFMLLLVLGSNLLTVFVGWEGVGLCSYLLISHWFTNPSYAKAGMKAFVVNRIGDAGFLAAAFIIAANFHSLEFSEIATSVAGLVGPEPLCTVLALLIFFACTGKSAQIPLFVWLPDAMAGPTPVSALIHAATMVTAGIYLTARIYFIFDLAPLAQALICLTGIATAFVGAISAITQTDIKKVLAYSTVSQLGFMFVALATGHYWIALFHVTTHAFFKACLFLSAGSVIHGCHHEQDMLKMGGLYRFMPVTFFCYLVSTLAIAGVYPFSGYFSKHEILLSLGGFKNIQLQPFLPLLRLVLNFTALMTAFYMTRTLALTFFGSYRGSRHGAHNSDATQSHASTPHESPLLMTLPLVCLALLSIGGGYLLISELPAFLASSIKVHGVLPGHHESGATEVFSHLLDSLPAILAILMAIGIYSSNSLPKLLANVLGPLYHLSKEKFYIDEAYDLLIVKPFKFISGSVLNWVDSKLVDGVINQTGKVSTGISGLLNMLQTNQIRDYSLYLLAAAAICLLSF